MFRSAKISVLRRNLFLAHKFVIIDHAGHAIPAGRFFLATLAVGGADDASLAANLNVFLGADDFGGQSDIELNVGADFEIAISLDENAGSTEVGGLAGEADGSFGAANGGGELQRKPRTSARLRHKALQESFRFRVSSFANSPKPSQFSLWGGLYHEIAASSKLQAAWTQWLVACG